MEEERRELLRKIIKADITYIKKFKALLGGIKMSEGKEIIRIDEWVICWSDKGKEIIFGLKESNGNEKVIKLNPKHLFKLQIHINHLVKYGIKYNYFKKLERKFYMQDKGDEMK